MSTPDQPLTRKQLREIQRTGATPIIVPAVANASAVDASAATHPPVSAVKPSVWAPEIASVDVAGESPASPAAVVPVSIDLEASPLTRREAREQERIRTASLAVISAEDAANAEAASHAEAIVEPDVEAIVEQDVAEPDVEAVPEQSDAEHKAAEPVEAEEAVPDTGEDAEASITIATEPEALPEPVPVLYAGFGGNLLADDPDVSGPSPTSFDQLIARGGSTTGSATATNALILSQTPSSAPLAGAVTATGEILVTGTLSLPEGLGSTGHDPRLSDGKEIDALLVDGGELPTSSSPTPVAASAAISTIKSAGDIIKPPAPEKGSRLMLTLAITAGVLALALVGVLILGFISGALR